MSRYAARVRRVVKRLRPMVFDNYAAWVDLWFQIASIDYAMDRRPPSLPPLPPADLPPTRIVRSDADRVEANRDILRRLEPHFGKRWWNVEFAWRWLYSHGKDAVPIPPPPLPEGVPRVIFGHAKDVLVLVTGGV
jgi:hypothetical protein